MKFGICDKIHNLKSNLTEHCTPLHRLILMNGSAFADDIDQNIPFQAGSETTSGFNHLSGG
jgi:hypothetical protein